jgi:serine/threonine protein phosphatase PrpC
MLRVVESAAFTDTGRQRRVNEDALLSRTPLFAVADGMGGAQAGEIAARRAIDTLAVGVGDGIARSRIVELVRAANRSVHDASVTDPALSGMGTTVAVAHVGETELTIAHVGDSRAYLIREGQLRRLTEDHSLVEEMLRSGRLTPEEAANHPQRSIITRALGPEPEVDVEVHEYAIQRGDVVLLCSDGLTGMVPESRIGELVLGAARLDIAGRALIAAANAAGGRDNITVILFRIGDANDDTTDIPAIDPDDQPTSIISPVGGDTAVHEVHTTVIDSDAVAAGSAGFVTSDLEAALAADPEAPTPLQPRDPRLDKKAAKRARRQRRGRLVPALIAILITLAIIASAGWVATQATYFVGSSNGFVAIYQGVPYKLPFGLNLYTKIYESGVPVSSLTPSQQHRLLNHEIRSNQDAKDLVSTAERNELQ